MGFSGRQYTGKVKSFCLDFRGRQYTGRVPRKLLILHLALSTGLLTAILVESILVITILIWMKPVWGFCFLRRGLSSTQHRVNDYSNFVLLQSIWKIFGRRAFSAFSSDLGVVFFHVILVLNVAHVYLKRIKRAKSSFLI